MVNRQGSHPALCSQPRILLSSRLSLPSTATCNILTAELASSPSSPTRAPTDASPHTLPRRKPAWIYTGIYKPGLFLFLQAMPSFHHAGFVMGLSTHFPSSA